MRDHVEAAKWYLQAAHQGHVWSQIRLAEAFASGIGVPKDLPEAFVWYDIAADNNVPSRLRRDELIASLPSDVVKREKVRSSVLRRQIEEKVRSVGERTY